MTNVILDVQGPDYFCPDCGRWLARVKPGGVFDLAGNAAVSLVAEVDVDPSEAEVVAPTLMAEAICYRLPCRFKRWLRGYRR